jgi:FAD synthase
MIRTNHVEVIFEWISTSSIAMIDDYNCGKDEQQGAKTRSAALRRLLIRLSPRA